MTQNLHRGQEVRQPKSVSIDASTVSALSHIIEHSNSPLFAVQLKYASWDVKEHDRSANQLVSRTRHIGDHDWRV